MAAIEQNAAGADRSRRMIFIIVSLITAVLIAGLFYLIKRPTPGGTGPQRLAGALHPGDAEFEQYRERIVLDPPEATEAPRAIGDIVMVLETTARNFTGRTITGLEVKGTVVDLEKKPIREQIVTVVPGRQAQELEPNKTIPVRIRIEGFSKSDVRANIKTEVVGIRFK